MAKSPKAASASDADPVSLEEPVDEAHESYERGESPWLRGLWMLLFAALFQVAQWVLWVATVLQFLWLLFAKEKNEAIAEFGDSLSNWLARVTRFQTGASENKPFPFSPWGK